jgi:hypothetical protein
LTDQAKEFGSELMAWRSPRSRIGQYCTMATAPEQELSGNAQT